MVEAEAGLDALVGFVDERDEGDGQAAAFGGHLGEVVEAVVQWRIEDAVLFKNLEPRGFVLNHGNGDHCIPKLV